MNLSPNFTLEELTFSEAAVRQGIDNTPDQDVIDNLTRLCAELLEPARTLLGLPLHINSGYRSPAVNAQVGGSEHSAHMVGLAADIVPIGMSVLDAFDILRGSSLPFDQIIYECQAWVHLGLAGSGVAPRKQELTATGHPGAWVYQVVA